MRIAPVFAALVALLLLAAPAAALDPGPGACAPYTVDPTQEARYLCVEADPACPVYTRAYDGVTWGPKTCLADEVSPTPVCLWTGQDLDYTHYACVAPRDADCPVYSLRETGGHSVKTCLL